MADTQRVGAALKHWREERGLTQIDVAATVGVKQGTISTSESGGYSAGLLLRLIALYRPTATELAEAFGVEGPPVETPDAPGLEA